MNTSLNIHSAKGIRATRWTPANGNAVSFTIDGGDGTDMDFTTFMYQHDAGITADDLISAARTFFGLGGIMADINKDFAGHRVNDHDLNVAINEATADMRSAYYAARDELKKINSDHAKPRPEYWNSADAAHVSMRKAELRERLARLATVLGMEEAA